MHTTTVEERIFENIKRVILEEEFQLKNLANKGIYFMPEQAFFYQISKSLLVSKQLIFGDAKVQWLKDMKVGDAGVVDLILKVEKQDSIETFMFQFKFRDDYEAYLRDAMTLTKIHRRGYHVRNPQLFLCALVDTTDGLNDHRIQELEASNEVNLERAGEFLVFSTEDEIHRKNVQCVVCLWKVLP
jgi:hypothetical protein